MILTRQLLRMNEWKRTFASSNTASLHAASFISDSRTDRFGLFAIWFGLFSRCTATAPTFGPHLSEFAVEENAVYKVTHACLTVCLLYFRYTIGQFPAHLSPTVTDTSCLPPVLLPGCGFVFYFLVFTDSALCLPTAPAPSFRLITLHTSHDHCLHLTLFTEVHGTTVSCITSDFPFPELQREKL